MTTYKMHGLWRVLTAPIYCDFFLATIEFTDFSNNSAGFPVFFLKTIPGLFPDFSPEFFPEFQTFIPQRARHMLMSNNKFYHIKQQQNHTHNAQKVFKSVKKIITS